MDSFRAVKRRRALDNARNERVAAMEAMDDDKRSELGDGIYNDDSFQSDEEPDEEQLALMQRTAAHLHSSPDRMRLAARILANHGADRRFAFLRGRWKHAWMRAQRTVEQEAARKMESEKVMPAGLIGLSGYGESDGENSSEDDASSTVADADRPQHPSVPTIDEEEEAKKEARRRRAREWALRRRQNLSQELTNDSSE